MVGYDLVGRISLIVRIPGDVGEVVWDHVVYEAAMMVFASQALVAVARFQFEEAFPPLGAPGILSVCLAE